MTKYYHNERNTLFWVDGFCSYRGNPYTGVVKWNTVLRTYKNGIDHGIMIRDFDF